MLRWGLPPLLLCADGMKTVQDASMNNRQHPQLVNSTEWASFTLSNRNLTLGSVYALVAY